MGIYVCRAYGQEAIWGDTVTAPEMGEKVVPHDRPNPSIFNDLIPYQYTKQITPPILSFQRLFSPWISPIGYSYGYESGKNRANFGAGISYSMIRHIALTFEAHRDWASKNAMFQVSLKMY
jgi:hypothetical protein